jgi:hypothetical protein
MTPSSPVSALSSFILTNDSRKKFQNYNVGLYLQYLPTHDTDDRVVDVSFTMRLLGGHATTNNQRLALEWSAGMRFVPLSQAQLRDGQANDFGTALMRSDLLSSFFAAADADADDDDDDEDTATIQVQLDLQLHEPPIRPKRHVHRNKDTMKHGLSSFFTLRDIRYPKGDELSATTDNDGDQNDPEVFVPTPPPHDTDEVRVGRVVVPICTKLSQRPNMFRLGIYPGVEYRILRIHTDTLSSTPPPPPLSEMEQDGTTDRRLSPSSVGNKGKSIDLFYSQPGALYDLKPIYPLVKQLERPWPVTVHESDIPKLCTPYQYNVISAIGSLLTAITGLAVAFLVSQCVSLYYIPSKSMDPTLRVGDVLLVEKISPKINGNY